MRELFEWLDRLETKIQSGQPNIEMQMKRASSPSTLDFDESLIELIDAQQEAASFGRVPSRLSVLVWPDEVGSGQSLQGQALAAQFGALLTLAANRRIEVAAGDLTLKMEGQNPTTFLPSMLVLDRSLSGPIGNDVRTAFEDLLSRLYGMSSRDQDVIGAAIELHYASAILFDLEPNAAYALAVAGIERLSQAYGSAEPEWSWWEDSPRFDATFDAIELSDEQKASLRAELLQGKHLRLRQTFASYVIDMLRDDFWEIEIEDFVPSLVMQADGSSAFTGMNPSGVAIPITNLIPMDPLLLRRRLLACYDSRSSYVHDGTGAPGVMSTTKQLIGQAAKRTDRVEYVGVRTILRYLVNREVEDRGAPRSLPDIKMRHARPKADRK